MNNRGHMVTKFAYPYMPKISQEFLPFSGYGVLDGGIVSGLASSGLMALNVVKTPMFLNSAKLCKKYGPGANRSSSERNQRCL